MAEDEIIKHTKKAISIFSNPEHHWIKKVKEILVEILIIIFAVSASIWLHNWSEERHDHKEEREFLLGLQKDLQFDIDNMGRSKEYYMRSLNGISYFLQVGNQRQINADSIKYYSGIFFGSTDLDPHKARYEGLKSSGKFKIIENRNLLNSIIDFHETYVQRIQVLNEKYQAHNEKVETLIVQIAKMDAAGNVTNAAEVLPRTDLRIMLNKSGGLIGASLLPEHEAAIRKCHEIIDAINQELN